MKMNHYCYEDIQEGMNCSFLVNVSQKMMDSFYEITGDSNELHRNLTYAHTKGYKSKVVYGMLTASFLSTIAGVYLPGEKSLIQKVEISFTKPVYVGDELEVFGEVLEKNDLFKFIVLKVSIKRGTEKVLRGKMQVGIIN
ncbi:MAG: dehydratase [Clostridia bacterium]|nr:dehydratase [Clostridia bacterium]